jgi:hypothetical protein
VPGRIRSIEKFNDLIRDLIRDLPTCRKVPPPTMLLHALSKVQIFRINEKKITKKVSKMTLPGKWA